LGFISEKVKSLPCVKGMRKARSGGILKCCREWGVSSATNTSIHQWEWQKMLVNVSMAVNNPKLFHYDLPRKNPVIPKQFSIKYTRFYKGVASFFHAISPVIQPVFP
jgi:hypothetical protein